MSISMHLRAVVVAGAGAWMGLACSGARGDVAFSDTEFPNAGWGFEQVMVGTGGTSAGTQVSGGNPGFARQMTNNVNDGGTIWGVSRFGTTTATRYVPSVDGAIASVDYSIDSRWLSGIGGQGQAIGLGLKQGSLAFVAALEITGSTGQWQTHSAMGLTAADFTPLTTGAVDFSETAEAIRFGFVVGNSSTAGAYSNVVMYDNFSVVVHSVPGPAAAVLPAMAAVAVGVRRRRMGGASRA